MHQHGEAHAEKQEEVEYSRGVLDRSGEGDAGDASWMTTSGQLTLASTRTGRAALRANLRVEE